MLVIQEKDRFLRSISFCGSLLSRWLLVSLIKSALLEVFWEGELASYRYAVIVVHCLGNVILWSVHGCFFQPIINIVNAAFKKHIWFPFLLPVSLYAISSAFLLLQNFLMLDEVSHFKPQLHGSNENIILHVQDLTCSWDKVSLLTY